MLYCLALEQTEELVKARETLEERLSMAVTPARETWGLLPSHQRAMAKAAGQGAVGGGPA